MGRHDLRLMCAICEQAPATVSCKADAALLCSVCDVDVHSSNPIALRHQRFPISDLFERGADFLLDEEDSTQIPLWLVPDLPNGMIDLPGIGLVTPPLFEAGFRQVERAPSPISGAVEFDFRRSKAVHVPYSVLSSDSVMAPDRSRTSKSQASEATGQSRKIASLASVAADRSLNSITATSAVSDRVARVMRYREKRKTLRFERTIRYASKKACSETRPRVKGKFAKRHSERCSWATKSFGERYTIFDFPGYHC